jgi:hypothetical protein
MYDVSLGANGKRAVWGGLAMALLLTACGREKAAESAPASGAAADRAAAIDTAPPAPQADSAAGMVRSDTSPAAAATRPDTASARRAQAQAPAADTAEKAAKPAAETAAKPTRPEPAINVRPKPTPRPAPAPRPEPQQPSPTAATPTDTPTTAAADTQAAPETSAQADAPLRDAYHQAPRDTVSQAVYDGWKQYNLNCARCHGEDALGTTIAPHLILSLKPDGPINTPELFTQVVCAGRPEKGMPAWCALGLEMDKIQAIYGYVKGRSAGEIGPGRPAVKQGG